MVDVGLFSHNVSLLFDPLYRPLHYNWEGMQHLVQGLAQSFAVALLFSLVWSAALHHPPQDKTLNCNCVVFFLLFLLKLTLCFDPGGLEHFSSCTPWTSVVVSGCDLSAFSFLSSFFQFLNYNIGTYSYSVILVIINPLQVVSTRTEPSQQSSGLALLERVLGQELQSSAWHLLTRGNLHRYHIHGYLLLPPMDCTCLCWASLHKQSIHQSNLMRYNPAGRG